MSNEDFKIKSKSYRFARWFDNIISAKTQAKIYSPKPQKAAKAAAGIAMGAFGCGGNPTYPPSITITDAGLLPDSSTKNDTSVTKTTDISPEPDIDPIVSLEARVTAVLKQDQRFRLYNYKTKQKYDHPRYFVQDLIKEYKFEGAQKTIASLEKAAQDLKTIESKLKGTYKATIFFKEVGFEVADSALAGGGHANADDLRITLFPPAADSYNQHTEAIIGHEYGHFLYFHDTNGKTIIPPNTASYPIDMAEMTKNGVVNRYHLREIYFLPYLTTPLPENEYFGLSEMLAHKASYVLVGINDTKSFQNMFLTEVSNTVKKNPKIYTNWQLLFALAIAKVNGLSNHETYFSQQLLTNGLSQAQIDSGTKQITSFYNSIQVVDY